MSNNNAVNVEYLLGYTVDDHRPFVAIRSKVVVLPFEITCVEELIHAEEELAKLTGLGKVANIFTFQELRRW